MTEEAPDIFDDGHIDIAHPVVNKFTSYRLSGEEWQVLWVIIQKTWAWHKPWAKIPLRTFHQATNIKKPRILRLIQKLIDKNIVTKKGNANPYNWHINSHIKTWKTLPKKVTNKGVTKKGNKTLPKKVNPIPQKGNAKSPKPAKQKPKQNPKEIQDKEKSKETLSIEKEDQLFAQEELSQEQVKEGERLMAIYYRTHKGYLARLTKEFQTRRKIRMRQLIDGTLLEEISPKVIEMRIKESSSGIPWEILTEDWIRKQINKKRLREEIKGTWY